MRGLISVSWMLLLVGCQSVDRSFQRIAAHLTKIEQSQIDIDSPADSLQWAITAVDSLQSQAQLLLEEADPRRLQTPYSQILNRLNTYHSFLEKFEQDASLYSIGGELQQLLSQPNLPLKEKIAKSQAALEKAPQYYQQARLKLSEPDTASLQLAIRKQILGIHFLENNYPDSLTEARLDKEKYESLINRCRFAMKDYIAWCNSQIIEQSQ